MCKGRILQIRMQHANGTLLWQTTGSFPFPTPGLFQTALRLPVGVCSFFFSSKRNKVSHISLVWFGQGLKETIWTRLEGNHLDKVGRKPF